MIKTRRVLLTLALVLVIALAGPSARLEAPSSRHTLHAGISYGDTLVWMSDEQLNQALDDAVDLGATWVRATAIGEPNDLRAGLRRACL